jgi:hypothetical protein
VTDKPTDPKLYVGHGLAADMANIFDAEAVAQVVTIGNDWCVRVLSPAS